VIRSKETKRYAKAFLDTVGIENAPQAFGEINLVNNLMVRSKEFKSLLANPQFSLQERETVIKQIATKLRLSDNIVKFVLHLCELRLILHLSEIIWIATSLYLEKKKRAKAVVMTPMVITQDYGDKLKASLKKLMDRDIDIEYVVDPSLIGGVLIKVGSTMYDTSIKGQLRLLRNELIKG
jgi:ATP synthase F1 delta subunit